MCVKLVNNNEIPFSQTETRLIGYNTRVLCAEVPNRILN